MKKEIVLISLGLVLMPVFCDDISQNLNKLNAAKLLMEDGNKNLLQTADVQKENAKTALGILQNVEIQPEAENFEKTYLVVCAKANLVLQNYEEVKSLWNKAEEIGNEVYSEELKYFAACAFFQTEDYAKCIKLLQEEKQDNENRVYYQEKNLLASAYFKTGNYSEAGKIYEFLKQNNRLGMENSLDYSRILYRQKQYKKASELLLGNESEEALLLRGACALSQKNYGEAASFYGNLYSVNSDNLEALYYKAYSEYKSSRYTDSGRDFELYANKTTDQKLGLEACRYATLSYLLIKNYGSAEVCAEKYVETAVSDSDKEKAIILLGDIYSDEKKYDQAINLYNKYAKQNKSYSAKCMYKMAIIHANIENYVTASDTFAQLYQKYPVSKEAEESLFRSGEVLYLSSQYEKAAPKLKNYSETFNKGIYTNTAMYYEFDSYVKSKDITKALLTGNKIISQHGDSEYLDSVLDTLYQVNYERGDYRSALEAAEKLADRKGHNDSSLENKISYMKRILGGDNKELVLAEADFEAAGGKSTLEGRDKGTVYAKLLFQDSETKLKGIKLAGELLAIQEKDIVNERESAAVNSLILAEYFYEENRKAEAADKYLKAAEYSRMNGDSEVAAFSLYTAIECFVHLGKKGDANETAALLKQLYPDSKYSSAVRSLLK